METTIKKTENGLEINITDLQGKKGELLEAFQACSEGRCTCPTQEYEKVARLEIREGEEQIGLTITAKEDEEIDAVEIQKCLDHNKKRIAE